MTPAEILRRSLVVATQQAHHLFGAYQRVGLHAQRQFLDGIAQAERWCQLTHDEMFTHAIVLLLVEIVLAAVGFPERELRLTIPELQLLGNVEYIL